jgi:hypothetical protein
MCKFFFINYRLFTCVGKSLSFKSVFIANIYIYIMFTLEHKPNKIPKPQLIPFRIVGILTYFIFICFLMAPKSSYLKLINHKIVMWLVGCTDFIISLIKEKLSSQVLQHVCQVNVIELNFKMKQKYKSRYETTINRSLLFQNSFLIKWEELGHYIC